MTKNMTVAEMWQLRELLQKWEAEYTDKENYFKNRVVEYAKEAENAEDEDCQRCFRWLEICQEERKKVRHVIREVEFQLEDETGEVIVK